MTEFVESTAALIEALKAGQKRAGIRYITVTDEEATAIAEAIQANHGTERLT